MFAFLLVANGDDTATRCWAWTVASGESGAADDDGDDDDDDDDDKEDVDVFAVTKGEEGAAALLIGLLVARGEFGVGASDTKGSLPVTSGDPGMYGEPVVLLSLP